MLQGHGKLEQGAPSNCPSLAVFCHKVIQSDESSTNPHKMEMLHLESSLSRIRGHKQLHDQATKNLMLLQLHQHSSLSSHLWPQQCMAECSTEADGKSPNSLYGQVGSILSGDFERQLQGNLPSGQILITHSMEKVKCLKVTIYVDLWAVANGLASPKKHGRDSEHPDKITWLMSASYPLTISESTQ